MSDPNYVLMLTSSDLEVDKLWENLGSKTKVKILYVPTAAMWLDPESTSNRSPGERRSRQRASKRKRMKCLAARIEEGRAGSEVDAVFLDVSDPKITSGDMALRFDMATSDVLIVDGGNTWFLWHHMKRTGLDILVKQSHDLVYVGISAGAIVAGKDISTALWKGWDKPIEELNPNVKENVIGMDLAQDRSFFPHYSPEWQTLVSERSQDLDHPCVLLQDKIAIIGEDDAASSNSDAEASFLKLEDDDTCPILSVSQSWVMVT